MAEELGDRVGDHENERIDRRAMLRRGGAVLAGAAGATALGAVASPSAGAAPGDPVLQGNFNDAGIAATTLASGSMEPTLALYNDTGAVLRLGVNSFLPNVPVEPGDVISTFGEFIQVHNGGSDLGEASSGWVHTSFTSNTLVPVPPTRLVDTRNPAGRTRILNPGALDSQKRVRAGQAVKVRLSQFVFDGAAMNCNLTAVAPSTGGFLSLVPDYSGVKPTTSSLNFSAGQTIANFAVTPLGHDVDPMTFEVLDHVWIYASQPTHVLLDVSGFVAGDYTQVSSDGSFVVAATSAAADSTGAASMGRTAERKAAGR